MSNTVYIVRGMTGEYSDYRTWNVAAFTDREKAEEWAALCQAQANEYFENFEERCEDHTELVSHIAFRIAGNRFIDDKKTWIKADRQARREVAEKYNKYDLDMRVDYTGTRYVVDEVPMDLERKEGDDETCEEPRKATSTR